MLYTIMSVYHRYIGQIKWPTMMTDLLCWFQALDVADMTPIAPTVGLQLVNKLLQQPIMVGPVFGKCFQCLLGTDNISYLSD